MKTRKPRRKVIDGIVVSQSSEFLALNWADEELLIDPSRYSLFHLAQLLIRWAWWFEEQKDSDE